MTPAIISASTQFLYTILNGLSWVILYIFWLLKLLSPELFLLSEKHTFLLYSFDLPKSHPSSTSQILKYHFPERSWWPQQEFSLPHIYRHILFYLCFEHITFYKLKVCGNLASNKSIDTIFSNSIAHLVCLCHVLVIPAIFQTFLLLLILLWGSVFSDLWCYYCEKIMTTEGSYNS